MFPHDSPLLATERRARLLEAVRHLAPARRRGACAACALPIERGEVITYEREIGPKHMACADLDGARRRNLYPMPCDLCGTRLKPGQGALTVVESLGRVASSATHGGPAASTWRPATRASVPTNDTHRTCEGLQCG